MPKITEFFGSVSQSDLEKLRADSDAKSAQVVRIEPFANNATEANANVSEIRIIFDKPLDESSFSVNLSEHKDERFPEVVGGRRGIAFAGGNREFTMKIKLNPNTKYGFVVSDDGFRTDDVYPLKNYKISFKTK